MQPNLLTPPKTLMEVYRMLPEGTRAELINDTLYMSPAPTLSHQTLVFKLAGQFYNYLNEHKNGELFLSPVDLFLDGKNAFQPDLAFIASKSKAKLKEDGIYGTPDLIIEVLSPGSKKNDLDKKMKAYEKAGVKEYWVVDPMTKISIGFQLKKKEFLPLKEEKGKLTSPLLKHTFKF